MKEIRLNNFCTAYFKAALEEINQKGLSYTIYDIEEDNLWQVKEDCLDFEVRQGRYMSKLFDLGLTQADMGKEFWLARNHKPNRLEAFSDIYLELKNRINEYGVSQVYIKNEQLLFTNLPYDRIKNKAENFFAML